VARSGDLLQYVTDFSQLKGNEFDLKYVRMIVADHRGDINLFEDAADSKILEV